MLCSMLKVQRCQAGVVQPFGCASNDLTISIRQGNVSIPDMMTIFVNSALWMESERGILFAKR